MKGGITYIVIGIAIMGISTAMFFILRNTGKSKLEKGEL